jgi:hypothetical protein
MAVRGVRSLVQLRQANAVFLKKARNNDCQGIRFQFSKAYPGSRDVSHQEPAYRHLPFSSPWNGTQQSWQCKSER